MGLISLILKILGFPDFPKKGEKTFNANETTFGSNLIVAGETVQQSNSVTLREKLICGNLWMLKNPFDRKPFIPNIFGSFGTILGWSGVYVNGILQNIGATLTVGSNTTLGASDVSFTALKAAYNPFKVAAVKKKKVASPNICYATPIGNLYGFWFYNSREISTEPDRVGSDIRLKKNIERFDNGLDVVLNLKPVRFDWREDICSSSFLQKFRGPDDQYGYPGEVKRQYGLIAQEVEDIAPDLVGETPMNGEKYKTIRYEKIVPILISAIQDQQKKIEELQREINSLKENNK